MVLDNAACFQRQWDVRKCVLKMRRGEVNVEDRKRMEDVCC